MHRTLRVEMVKRKITISKLASEIGIADKTLRNKINGDTDFTRPEAQAIRKILNSDMTLDELFETEEVE